MLISKATLECVLACEHAIFNISVSYFMAHINFFQHSLVIDLFLRRKAEGTVSYSLNVLLALKKKIAMLLVHLISAT